MAVDSAYPGVPDAADGETAAGYLQPDGVGAAASAPFFFGFPRGGGRGVGTRNFIVVVPVSATCGAVARTIARRTRAEARRGGSNVDGVIALEHTENSGSSKPHNLDFVRRALAGFVVHPNAAAALIVSADDGTEALSGEELKAWMLAEGYPVDHCHLALLSTRGQGFREAVEAGVQQVLGWVPTSAACKREMRPVSDLRLALQCGGSDAFSGVSGNPLAGQLAREVVRRGGAAVLAETDELITAEAWILRSVRDMDVARRFVGKVKTFRDRLAAHGQTAEANPSGGNLWRGLTGISLKSLGAGMKKPADVRLDGVLDYAQRLPPEGGYQFMDSPGNDLESLAGQIATGANVVTFTSGNGSVAGNSFVPVIKIVTTTARFCKLKGDMDINAGLLLDGVPMDRLTRSAFKQLLGVASGKRTAGERAGHYQMQIWRDWPIDEGTGMRAEDRAPAAEEAASAASGTGSPSPPTALEDALARLEVDRATLGRPAGGADLLFHSDSEHSAAADSAGHGALSGELAAEQAPKFRGTACTGPGGYRWPAPTFERVGLIVPTSLCSAQTASMVAARLNLAVGAAASAELLDAAGTAPLAPAGPCSAETSDAAGVAAAAGDSRGALPPKEAESKPAVAVPTGFDRFVALPHTEGCGSGGPQDQYYRVIAGHATHPLVGATLFVEHGCEMAHNDNVRAQMRSIAGEDKLWGGRVGWASVQQDGGVEAISRIAADFFAGHGLDTNAGEEAAPGSLGEAEGPISSLVLGLHIDADLDAAHRASLRRFVRAWVRWGGAVVVPETCPMLAVGAGATLRFAEAPARAPASDPTLAPSGVEPGVYVMRCPTRQWTEVLTGLGAAGCAMLVAVSARSTVQGHPLVPTIVCAPTEGCNPDADVVLQEGSSKTPGGGTAGGSDPAGRLLQRIGEVASREATPSTLALGNTAWQITRGLVCVSV